jgi:phage tail sheath protein FI
MAFQVSPGVQVQEIDLTSGVPAVSASIGGYAGVFNWGPADEIRLISSEKELASTYGAPSAVTADQHLDGVSFLTAASFLKYGNALKVVRSVGTGALNASVSGNGILVKNSEAYATATLSAKGAWIAKYPGALGNSLQVQVCAYSSAGAAFTGWTDGKSYFSGAPGTSAFAAANGSSNDEIHILILDKNGAWTGTAGTVLERFAFLSQALGAKNSDGLPSYYVDVINNSSKYIWFANKLTGLPSAGTAVTNAIDFMNATGAATTAISSDLADGADGTVAAGDINSSLDILAGENVDLNLLFAAGDPDGSGSSVAGHLIEIAEARKDLVAFVSPAVSATAQSTDPLVDVLDWYSGSPSSSYAVYDSTALKVYDKYNDIYRWIPAAGHIAGLCARTDNVADAWYSPAGYNRGVLLGVTKIAYNPAKADRDELFKNKINPIVAFPGQGIVLYGDKTALSKPSAFDAINVRRLFITLEKSISTFAKFQLFEFNDEFTRAAFRNAVEPFLREVQGRRGITDFKVVCDETNNTGDVIDRNEFVADIYIKPARAIRGITLNFIATRTGVSFTELGA